MSLEEKEQRFWDAKAKKTRNSIDVASKEELAQELLRGDYWWEQVFARITCKRILDVGCGTGNFTAYLGISGNRAYGLDLSKGGLLNALLTHKKLGLDAKLVNSTVENLPFKDGSFDIVHMRWVIHHLSREKIICSLREIQRILRKDGCLLLFETNYLFPVRRLVQASRLKFINMFRRIAIQKGFLDPEEKALAYHEYIELLENVDFKIVRVHYQQGILWYLPKLFIANKSMTDVLEKLDKYLSENFVPKAFSINVMIVAQKNFFAEDNPSSTFDERAP
jgi:ubiquinone/menaquinone biosynthesis C-methylase UbiE